MKAKIHTLLLTLLFPGFTALSMSGCVVDNTPPPSCLDQQFATIGWDIVRNSTNDPITCETAGADMVVWYFGNIVYPFPCNAYSGFSDPGLPPGNYLTSFQLLAPDNRVLSDTAINNPPVTYPILQCAPYDIPQVTFAVQ